jgi:hypothetical protein
MIVAPKTNQVIRASASPVPSEANTSVWVASFALMLTPSHRPGSRSGQTQANNKANPERLNDQFQTSHGADTFAAAASRQGNRSVTAKRSSNFTTQSINIRSLESSIDSGITSQSVSLIVRT